MAKKAKKGAAKKKAQAKEKRGSPWMGEQAPWEERSDLQIPIIGDENEIVRILEIGDGKLKITEPPPVSEDDEFAFGSSKHARTVFSQSNPDEVLLTEEIKIIAMEQSYRFYRENSSYHADIKGYRNFIIGKGVKLTARDENPKVQEYLDLFSEVNGMDGKDARLVLIFLKTGELAIRWFEEDANGRPAKVPKIRFIPFWRITKVIKDPEDDEKDIEYEILVRTGSDDFAGTKPTPIKPDKLSMWRHAEPEEARGEPPFLVIMRSCTWYSDWLKNRVVLNRFRTAHVLFKKIIGGTPGKVSKVSNAAPDAATKKGLGGKVEKRLPKPGTIVTHGENVEYEWKSPDLGASDAKEDGRHIKLDIVAGAQVPEFLLGDASNANRASVLTAEDPFVREVEFWQDFFKGIFQDIAKRVIEHGIKVKAIPPRSKETIIQESSGFMRRVNRVLGALKLKEINEQGDAVKTRPIDTRTDIDVEYPIPVHKDELKEVEALQIDQAMGLASVETLRTKRGYEHETEERRIEGEREAGADRFETARKKEIEDDDDDDDEDK